MRFGRPPFVLALTALLLGWVGCSSEEVASSPRPATSGGDAGPTATDAAINDAADAAPVSLEPYRIVGRFDVRDPAGPRFGWPGTQVIARFTGDAVRVDLADTTGEDQLDVSIDGKEPTLLRVDSKPRKTYELATGLGAGEHTLVLTKRTESSVGELQLFEVKATLIGTPPPPSRRIELVGDSITAGYGVLGASSSCAFSPDTENEALAWGALAAKELGASHTAIAWSGIGLLHDYDGNTAEQMPDRYGRALGSDATSTWTASQFEPDVVVIALGTNDFDGQDGASASDFQAKLVTFTAAVRAAHPAAPIVLATSPLLDGKNKTDQTTAMKGAIAARTAAGDAKLSLLEIDTVLDAEGFGCDFHPSRTTQQRMGTALAAHIEKLTGW